MSRKNKTFKASDEEWAAIQRVAKRRGVSASQAIRELAKKQDREDRLKGS